MAQPVLVTLTSPSCSGKSYLLNYIREVMPQTCLVSTTTRPPRAGEREGVDYYFISETESRAIEAQDGFAELMTYNGYRYGVTKQEFREKLETGLAFLIVEPIGIDHYVAPALEVGATHLKVFVDAPEDLRIQRMRERLCADLKAAVDKNNAELAAECALTHFNRTVSMLTHERMWRSLVEWDLVLDGTEHPAENLAKILRFIRQGKD